MGLRNVIITPSFFETEKVKSNETLLDKSKFFTIKGTDGNKAKVYVYQVMHILINKQVPIMHSSETFDGTVLISEYIDAYKEGVEYFKREFAINPNTLFNNPEPYIRNLHIAFFHAEPIKGKNGWDKWINTYPTIITSNKTIAEYGFFAGVISELKELQNKYPVLFIDFENRCDLQKIHNSTSLNKVGTSVASESLDDLFYDKKLIRPTIEILRQLNTDTVTEDLSTFIGKASMAVIWVQELINKSIIKPESNKKLAALLKTKFNGFSIDASMFNRDKISKEAETFRLEIKALLQKIKGE